MTVFIVGPEVDAPTRLAAAAMALLDALAIPGIRNEDRQWCDKVEGAKVELTKALLHMHRRGALAAVGHE